MSEKNLIIEQNPNLNSGSNHIETDEEKRLSEKIKLNHLLEKKENEKVKMRDLIMTL